MFNNARAFLQKVLPWGEPGAFFNLHWKTTKLDRFNKPIWNSRAYLTPDEMLNGLSWVTRLPDAKDVYVCMSAQSKCDERTSGKGNKYRMGIRGTMNAVALKSLYIDVDVKEGAYPTTEDALRAFQKFLQDSGMPMPTAVVATGSGGFHAHWTLVQALKREKWQLLANALARCVQVHGLIADTQCTIDAARVLRVPETLNYKVELPNPVTLLSLSPTDYTLDKLQPALAPHIGVTLPGKAPVETVIVPFERRTPITGISDLAGGIEEGSNLKDIDDVARSCKFIGHALNTNGADYDNPKWFLTLRVAQFCEDGRAVAHDLSCGHPGYSEADTDAEFDRAERDHVERGIGWPSCAKIDAVGSSFCRSCKFFPQAKSPLHFAYAETPHVAPIQPQIPIPAGVIQDTVPAPYARDKDGYIWFAEQDEDTGQSIDIKVCDYPIMDGWLQDNPWVLHFTTVTSQGKKTKIEFPLAEFGTMGGVGKTLSAQGIVLSESKIKLTKEFLMAWTQNLQSLKDSVVSSTPFGWSMANGKLEGFTYASRVWGNGMDRPAALSDPTLASQYSPHGSLDPWVTAAKMITDQGRPALDVILAAAFAGPLVRFTGREGVAIAAYSSESGIGKTTALRIGQAVWGHPIKAANGMNDTSNSVLNKLGRLKHLPIFWDEFKGDRDTEAYSKILFTVSGGKEKNRLNANITQKDAGDWQTALVSASNDSLVDAIARQMKSTTAGLYRLFEFPVLPATTPSPLPEGAVSRMVGALNDNYGNAGLVYAKFIGSEHKRIEAEVAATHDRIATALESLKEERFWTATATVVIMGARYSNELGLTTINEDELEKFLFDTIRGMRGLVSDAPTDMKNEISVSTVLQQFLNAMRTRHTLYTDRINVGAGKPPPRKIMGATDKLDGVYVQIGVDDRMMRISSTFLTRWMSDHDYSRHAFTKALKDDFGVKVTHGRIGSGTTFAGATEYLLEIDMNDKRLANMME